MYGERDGIVDDRITLWRARSPAAAVAMARREAYWLGTVIHQRPLGVLDWFELPSQPADGAVVYQRFRPSPLGFNDYLDRHHDTGTELTQR
jgi:hypothetical protein